ncbi:MAG: nitroreductase family protein [Rikenellaceae bacterium]|jgi:nitroreductase|nr:nitroreductase family protein [Rikenellaceae bacterium]
MIPQIEQHRSIRKYKPDPVPQYVLEEILTAGTRASNTGNMQLYSMVVTRESALREALLPCHFGQRMVVEAPVVVTFCADVRRFSLWCRQRDAEPRYDNFVWFVNALTDAILCSQNVALEAENHGLGICHLGTTVYTADRIAQVLELPVGVIPVTTVVIGYPAEQPELTDRLPLDGVVHWEAYKDYTPGDIDRIWAAKEAGELTARLQAENELPNLARIFTDRRYKGEDNVAFSRKYFEILRTQGFFNQ